MKNLLIVIMISLVSFGSQAQNVWCSFDRHVDKMISEDPSLIQDVYEHQARAQELTRHRLSGEAERAGGARIIPTVFHIVHQGGSENISMEQIEDQMRILNEDYRRLNADASNTRAEFIPVAADSEVEFRLAKLDPQGDCTDGVVRVWSNLTYNATDAVKATSYWNSNKYFNVWVVATIDNDGEPGTVLGYAQFPGFGGATTDGVVVRADYIGSIGTAQSTGNVGRVLTHEAGHWLGLSHTFQGGCTGGFPFGEGVDDTSPTAEPNFGCPITRNSCNNDNPDLLDQVENYMDYSNGSCQNMFSEGQKDVMDAVLGSSRSQIHSGGNLTSTGVLLGETPCQPYAHFYAEERLVCTGQPIQFTDGSFNGTVAVYDWQFSGATPSSSSDQNPTVSYDSPGTYSVTLNVQNAQGTDSHSETDYVHVISSTAEIPGWLSFEGFEETEEDYIILSDEAGNTWQETATAFTGNFGIRINNFSGNPLDSKDEFLLPSVDMTQMNDPKIHFRLSHKQRSGKSDNLRIYASRNCGDSWTLRYNKSGAALATVNGTQGSPFTPSSNSDWEQVDVSMSGYANDEHVLVKFRNTSGEGNNIYIDDIQISGPLGISDNTVELDFSVSPNPTTDQAVLSLNVQNSGQFNISVMDVAGKLIATLHDGGLAVGQQSFNIGNEMLPNAGIYLVQVEYQGGRSVKKLVVQ